MSNPRNQRQARRASNPSTGRQGFKAWLFYDVGGVFAVAAIVAVFLCSSVNSAFVSTASFSWNRKNTEEKREVKISFGNPLFTIICFIAGFFIYGLIGGLLSALMATTVVIVGYFMGFLPIVGPLLYLLFVKTWLWQLFQNLGLEASWLTSFLLWLGLVIGIGTNGTRFLSKHLGGYLKDFNPRADELCMQVLIDAFEHWDGDSLRSFADGSTRYDLSHPTFGEEAQRFLRLLNSLDSYRSLYGSVRYVEGKPCITFIERRLNSGTGKSEYLGHLLYRVEFEKETAEATVVIVGNREHVALVALFFGRIGL